jgi:hypothetical protein
MSVQKLDEQVLAEFLKEEQVAVEEKSVGLIGSLRDRDGDDDFDVEDIVKTAMAKRFG